MRQSHLVLKTHLMIPLRVACIGCGFMSRFHLSVVRDHPGAVIAAVADIRAEAARAVAAEFGAPRWTTEPESLLVDPDIDAVILSLTPDVRLPFAKLALRHGKHLLIEKPAAMRSADLVDLIALRPASVVAASCSPRVSLLRSSAAARAALRQGLVGTPALIRFRRIQPVGATPPWAAPPAWRLSQSLNGGGLLINWGNYDLDLLLSLFDWRLTPSEVSAYTARPGPFAADHFAPGSDGETHIAATIRFAEGPVLHYERAEFHLGEIEDVRQICGPLGTLRIESQEPGAPVHLDTRRLGQPIESRLLYAEPGTRESQHAPGPTGDWIDSILSSRPPATDLGRALHLTRLIEAIYQSAQLGRAIRLSPAPALSPAPSPAPTPALANRA